MQQPLKFAVYDFDASHSQKIGIVKTTLGSIVGSRDQTLILDIAKKGVSSGKIIIRSEEVRGSSDLVYLELAARGVEDVETFSKSDPFITISKLRPDNTWVKVHQTEYIPNNLNPIWRGFQIPVSNLCSGDFFLPLRFEICKA